MTTTCFCEKRLSQRCAGRFARGDKAPFAVSDDYVFRHHFKHKVLLRLIGECQRMRVTLAEFAPHHYDRRSQRNRTLRSGTAEDCCDGSERLLVVRRGFDPGRPTLIRAERLGLAPRERTWHATNNPEQCRKKSIFQGRLRISESFGLASQLGVTITPIKSKSCPADIEIGTAIFNTCSVVRHRHLPPNDPRRYRKSEAIHPHES